MMDEEHDAVTVEENAAAQRFEAHVGQYLAFAEYQRDGETIIFTHTEVPTAIEGHGIASALAHTALEHAQAHYLTVIPQCPFFASYIRRHSQFASLVPAEYLTRLNKNPHP